MGKTIMENFEEFKQEVIDEIKSNPHLYPNICRRMVRKIEEQDQELERLKAELSKRVDAIERINSAITMLELLDKEQDAVMKHGTIFMSACKDIRRIVRNV